MAILILVYLELIGFTFHILYTNGCGERVQSFYAITAKYLQALDVALNFEAMEGDGCFARSVCKRAKQRANQVIKFYCNSTFHHIIFSVSDSLKWIEEIVESNWCTRN